MKAIDAKSSFWICRTCSERAGSFNRVRVTKPGESPTLGCTACDGKEWIELSGAGKLPVLEQLGPTPTTSLRLFFCYRCGADGGLQILEPNQELRPCHCGSRYFRELVGPEKTTYLRRLKRGGNGGGD